jgi:hypothetical protein
MRRNWTPGLESLEARRVLAGGPYIHIHDSSQLAVVDASTGEVQKLGNLSANISDIAFSPQGRLFGITSERLFEINPVTAALTDLGAHGIPDANGLVFSGDGKLYVAARSQQRVFVISDVTQPQINTPINLSGLGATGSSNGDISFIGADLILASTNENLIRYRFDVDPNRPRVVADIALATTYLVWRPWITRSSSGSPTRRSCFLT